MSGSGRGGAERTVDNSSLDLARVIAAVADAEHGSDVLVLAVGEFGRSPKINDKAGREHHPGCYSALAFGGGVGENHTCLPVVKQVGRLGDVDFVREFPLDDHTAVDDEVLYRTRSHEVADEEWRRGVSARLDQLEQALLEDGLTINPKDQVRER